MNRLDIDGVVNARDVGGLPAEGGRVRTGALLRSGSIAHASAQGIAALRQHADHIIDLRDDDEVRRDPSAVTGIPTTRVPLFLGSVASYFERDVTLVQLYQHLVDDCGDRIATVARLIARPEATLVHCTVGKDRTGVAVALALASAGVAADAIVQDYALTASELPAERNAHMQAIMAKYHPRAKNALALATESPAEVIREVLAHVDARWGSATAYLHAHGMSAAETDDLRRALVEISTPDAAI